MEITKLYSPNYSQKKRSNKKITSIIIHYTGMQSERESIRRLSSKNSKVSCHYLINRKGNVFRMVKDENIAWHAGKSMWGKYKNLNKNSIGIELVNKGHKYGYQAFTKIQIKKLIKLCKYLKKKYKIKNNNILGHSDIAPLRKKDPGEKFPWKLFYKNKLSIWHNLSERNCKELRKIKLDNNISFYKLLFKFGYKYTNNPSDKIKILKNFQRRFRPELISSIVDKECEAILKSLIYIS